MSLRVVALVLASCVLHAWWNLLLKRARDKMAFTALFLLLTPLLYLPMALFLAGGARIPAVGWGCMLAASALYFGYFAALATAYKDGELSAAYPLARGVGPALALVWGVLFLRERPTGWGFFGVMLVVGATVLLVRVGRGKVALRSGLPPGAVLAALVVGLMYSLYSLTDKVGVGRLHIHPALYIYLTYAMSALAFGLWFVGRRGSEPLLAEWRANRTACTAVAALNVFSYLLVLYAMSLPGTPVSYVIPLRSVSVLIAVLLGVEVLQEGERWSKLGAAALMMAGIALMAWKG